MRIEDCALFFICEAVMGSILVKQIVKMEIPHNFVSNLLGV